MLKLSLPQNLSNYGLYDVYRLRFQEDFLVSAGSMKWEVVPMS